MTAISYHDTVKDLQDLAFLEAGPFARLQWFAMLENAGARPLLALAREGDDAILLPLTAEGGALEPLTNWYAFTWSPLATTAQPSASLLEALARDLSRRTSRAEFTKLPDEDGTATMIEAAFRAAGWRVRREACDTNHVLDLAGRGFAEYLATRPGPLRTTLKRKAKKVSISISQQFQSDDWQCYEQIYAQSWKPEEGAPALLRDFARGESNAGRYLFGMARHEGEPVAAQFWTVEGGTAYIHKLAHLESAKALSPGTALTAALLEHAIDRMSATRVDFGTGDDPYKADWMESVRPRYRLTCLRPQSPRNWPLIAGNALRTLVSRCPAV